MSRIGFNINQAVYVKLNESGIEELRRQHDERRERVPIFGEFVPPKVDGDGYSRFQLWELMQHFGQMLRIGLYPLPFEAEILLDPES